MLLTQMHLQKKIFNLAAVLNYPKKGAMIYDGVKQRRTPESNLEELWKEVARDLITANQMGREDATAPAEQALSCLKANDP